MPCMVCPSCGRQHENTMGKCPFCSPKAALMKRQKQRGSEAIDSWIFFCEDCGEEIKDFTMVKGPFGMRPDSKHSCRDKPSPKKSLAQGTRIDHLSMVC